ncbi:MFS transporter [Alkalihalobacillus sp. R86527]|uniref:MFS transporter n=1 Tax=Alkalihalobacillus sp. R86527 TaxID=3093863 RepID=UPI00366E8E6F
MHKNIVIRIVFNLFERFSTSLFSPFLAIFFAGVYGSLIAGAIMMTFVLSSMLGNHISGSLSDIKGRKNLLVFADLVRGIGLLIGPFIYLVYVQEGYIIYITLLLVTFCGGISAPVFNAMIIDVTDIDTRKKVYTLLYWLTNVGLAIGVIIGGLMFEKYFVYSILISGILYLLIGLITIVYFEETLKEVKKDEKVHLFSFNANFSKYSTVLKNRKFMLITFSSLCFVLIENQLSNYLSIKISNNFNETNVLGFNLEGVNVIGFLQAENTIIVAVGSLVVFKFIKHIYKGNFLLISLLVFSLGYFSLAYFNSFKILMIAMFIASLAELVVMPALRVKLSNTIPKEQSANYSSVNSQIMSLGVILSSSLISMSSYLNYQIMAYVMLLISLIGICLFYIATTNRAATENSLQDKSMEG